MSHYRVETRNKAVAVTAAALLAGFLLALLADPGAVLGYFFVP